MANKFFIFLTICFYFYRVISSQESEFYSTDFYTRRITNLEIIYGSHGVPVLLQSYNETLPKDAPHFGSVPGCPQSIDGFPWVYYGNPPRCFLAGHNGPCALGEKLIGQKGSPFGICACECQVEDQRSQLEMRYQERYLYCRKFGFDDAPYGQIFDTEYKQCYNAFEQGPCKSGTVITDWTADLLSCLPVCDEQGADRWDQVQKGLCKNRPPVGVAGVASVLNNSDCPPSHRYSDALKKCVRKFGV